jgi:hypothetical protein
MSPTNHCADHEMVRPLLPADDERWDTLNKVCRIREFLDSDRI